MPYLEDLDKQIVEEYKCGNQKKRVFLQTLKAALQKKKIDLKDKYNEETELSTLKNELKQYEEGLAQQEEAGRDDLIPDTKEKINLLKQILPQQISSTELEARIQTIIDGLDDKSFGNVMKHCMAQLKSTADGGQIAQSVKKIIG